MRRRCASLASQKRHFATRYSSLYVCIFYTKIANLVRLAAAQGVVDCAARGDPQCRTYCYFDCELPCTFHQLLTAFTLCRCSSARHRRRTLHTPAAVAAARRASAAMAVQGCTEKVAMCSGLQLLQRLCNFVAKIMNDSE